jgi:5-methylthioadenosine/S-adenosylhomocysteine deaminase
LFLVDFGCFLRHIKFLKTIYPMLPVIVMAEKLIVDKGIVFTVDKDFNVIENGSVVIEDGQIVDVGKSDAIANKYKGSVVIDARKKAVLPGLIDLHYHSGVFMKGALFPGKTLDEVLKEVFYPLMENITPRDVYTEALLSYVQSVKAGVTCVNNMYIKLIALADAAEDVGIRAILSSEMGDLYKGDSLEDNERAFLERHNSADGRVKVWFGVEWIPMSTSEFLEKVRDLAQKYKTGIHIHLHETQWEIAEVQKRFKKRPIAVAYDLGMLSSSCVAAHCVWLNDRDIEMLRETGTHVSHNPVSNMWCGAGFSTRVPDLLSQGVNVGLGTDSTFMGDMFESMKYASYLHKGLRLDRSVMPPEVVLRMATANGAKALDLDAGTIERGKKADIILVDLTTNSEPILSGKYLNVLPNLLYTPNSNNVDTVIIDGKIVMQNHQLKTVNEQEVVENAKMAAQDLMNKIL